MEMFEIESDLIVPVTDTMEAEQALQREAQTKEMSPEEEERYVKAVLSGAFSTPEQIEYDPWTDRLTIKRHLVHDPELDMTARIRSALDDADGGYTPSRDMKWVARITPDVYYWWLQHGVDCMKDEHWERVVQLLDHPDWSRVRTGGGHIGRRAHRSHPVTQKR